MNEANPPRCAIGLVTWNGERDVARCVRSALAQTEPNLEFVWIDNASTDGTIEAARRACPDFPEPIRLERNTGFCGGHDRAFAETRAPYYLALNQDAELAPDYVARLCDWMDAAPELALASGLLLVPREGDGAEGDAGRAGGANAIYSAGVAVGRGRFPYELGMGRPVRPEDRERRFVPAVTGAAMMLRRSAVATLGPADDDPTSIPFPKSFFAYHEEIDLAMRLAAAGFRAGVDGGAIGFHAARGRGGRGRPEIRRRYFANRWALVLRHASPRELLPDLPRLAKAELLHLLPQYVREPAAAFRGLLAAATGARDAGRFRDDFRRRFPEAPERIARFFDASLGELARDRRLSETES